MRKRLYALILLISLPVTAFASYKDVYDDNQYKEAIDNLTMYQIISGNGDGNFNPNGNITRSEFAKIATIVSGEKASTDASCIFNDVGEGFWANGYINCSAKNNLIIGYPDGTFHPYENLSYAQAVTVVLRLLGYTTQQLGNNYPNAYINKAQELGLTKDLSFSADQIIDRQTVAYIINNALMCDMYSTSTRKEKLITKLDYTVSDTCIILATGKDNKELLSDDVATTIGTFKTLDDDVYNYTTNTVKLIQNSDNEILGIIKQEGERKKIAVESTVGNQVAYRENGALKSIQFDSNSLIYYNLSKTTFSSVSKDLSAGMIIDIYYKNGQYDYSVVSKSDLLGPKVVYSTSDVNTMWNFKDGVRVIRDGYEKTLGEIETNDVLYYDSVLNTVYAYCDKVSGVYEKALPTKAQISSVTVSGVTYELETQSAVYSLGEYDGSYKINDYITLLLGKDGRVAGVAAKNNNSDSINYGVLISCQKKVVDKNQDWYATFLSSNGSEQEFKTDRDYTSYRGRVMSYKFENGYLKPTVLAINKTFAGEINQNAKTIGSYQLSSNAKIIDVAYSPAVNEISNAVAMVTELSDISKTQLTYEDILYVSYDKNGKINFLVLNNVTMKGYKFGLVTKVTKLSSSSTYTLDINGEESTYNVAFVSSPIAGQPVMACIVDNKMLKIFGLTKLSASGKTTEFNSSAITIGGNTYKLAKDAVVYKKEDTEYKVVDIDDIDVSKISSPELYVDKSVSNGGLVRVIKMYIKE